MLWVKHYQTDSIHYGTFVGHLDIKKRAGLLLQIPTAGIIWQDSWAMCDDKTQAREASSQG